MAIIKISDNEIKVTKVPETEEKTYTYEFLLEMKANLEAERARVIGKIDADLVEVNALIVEADRLGIKEKPEPIIEPIK